MQWLYNLLNDNHSHISDTSLMIYQLGSEVGRWCEQSWQEEEEWDHRTSGGLPESPLNTPSCWRMEMSSIVVKRPDEDPRLAGIADLGFVIPAVVQGN